MTPNTKLIELSSVEVIQADRDAAASLHDALSHKIVSQAARCGIPATVADFNGADDSHLVQAFARHRISSTPSSVRGETIEELRELSEKATSGRLFAQEPDVECDFGVAVIATDLPPNQPELTPTNGMVAFATLQPTEIDAKDPAQAEANAAFIVASVNYVRALLGETEG